VQRIRAANGEFGANFGFHFKAIEVAGRGAYFRSMPSSLFPRQPHTGLSARTSRRHDET
jgi:hypothetical protein